MYTAVFWTWDSYARPLSPDPRLSQELEDLGDAYYMGIVRYGSNC